MEERCLTCDGVLFDRANFAKRIRGTIDLKNRLDLEWDGQEAFFRCPHCSVKHVVIEAVDEQGLPSLRISHVKP